MQEKDIKIGVKVRIRQLQGGHRPSNRVKPGDVGCVVEGPRRDHMFKAAFPGVRRAILLYPAEVDEA